MLLGALLVFGAMFCGNNWERQNLVQEGAGLSAGVPAKPQTEGYVTRNSGRNSKFLLAIREGDINGLRALLRPGMNFDSVITVSGEPDSQHAITPLLEAVIGGHSEMVEFLLTHGASPNFHPPKTQSALHLAAWSGRLDVVKALLAHGAFVDERTENGETPLLLAAFHSKDVRLVQALIAAGANIYALDKSGNNAVMMSAWGHKESNFKLLVEAGVDPCAKNNSGETAIDQAKSNLNDDPGKQEIISFLQEKCGP